MPALFAFRAFDQRRESMARPVQSTLCEMHVAHGSDQIFGGDGKLIEILRREQRELLMGRRHGR